MPDGVGSGTTAVTAHVVREPPLLVIHLLLGRVLEILSGQFPHPRQLRHRERHEYTPTHLLFFLLRHPPAGAKSAMVGLSRTEVEKEGTLTFDGFLSFHCKTRADSKRVVRSSTLLNLSFAKQAEDPARFKFRT